LHADPQASAAENGATPQSGGVGSETPIVARQSGSESPTIRIRIRDCDVAIVFLLFVAGKRYV
jgi:hypothetical protein